MREKIATCVQRTAERKEECSTPSTRQKVFDTAVWKNSNILLTTVSLFLVAVIVIGGIGWMSEPVKAKSEYQSDEVEKPTVVDRTDKDRDGYISSFTIRWEADATIREAKRKDLDQDIRFRESEGNPFIKQGTPKFGLFGIAEQNGKPKYFLLDMKSIRNPRQESKTVEMEVSLANEDSQSSTTGNTLVKQKGLEGLALTFVESDSSPDVFVLQSATQVKTAIEEAFTRGSGTAALVAAGTDASLKLVNPDISDPSVIGRARYAIESKFNSDDYILTRTKTLNEPIRLEEPSEDATKQVGVTSNINGASVKIDGEEVGKTPWTGTYPVDYTERNGPATVEVSADGYVSGAKSVGIGSQGRQSVNLNLKKNKEPLVVNATPSNSSVYIEGSYIGQPPVKKKMWVKKSVDIWINNSAYTNKKFEDISPPRTIDWNFSASPSSVSTGSSYGSIGFVGGTYVPSFQTFDYLEPELNLEGVFWADFSYAPTSVRTGETVGFDGTQSYSLAGNITGYEWDFGDGTSATGQQPSHTYSSSGKYTVNLTITTQFGNTSSAEETIDVKNSPPTASFIPSATSVVKGDSVTFDASTSTDPENSIVRYEWDFNGDSSSEGSGQTATNAYASAGNYTVALTVTDDAGQSNTTTRTVKVRRPNSVPQPRVDVSTEEMNVNQTVTFDASATSDPDGSVQTYNWELGDGTQTNGETVSHSYNASGTYRVTLLVADDRGKIASTTETVTVASTDDSGSGEQTREQRENQTSSENATSEEEGQGGDESQGMPGFGYIVATVAMAACLVIRKMNKQS